VARAERLDGEKLMLGAGSPGANASASPFARLRARLAARPDTEHEQALVRMLNSAALCVYLFPQDLIHWLVYVVYALYLFAGIAILAAIATRPGPSPLRRVLGAAADAVMVTWVLMEFGEGGAALYLIFLWITLANGFRYGAKYLLITLALCVAGFGTALLFSEFWVTHRTLGIGLMVGLIAVSLYVRRLVTQLFDALARAESANQAKRRFISVVSHEMRTPLNAIIGMADLMRDTSLNREQADMLQTLRGSSRVMLGLVEDVLDFSKIEAGKLALEKTDFDLHALVNSTCRIVAAQAAAKGIEFVVSIMPEVAPAVRGDPHHLRQILINLAGNAVKFTERGSVTVHVSARSESDSSMQLKFSIRDTGIGIAPEAQERIFESFTQADQSTTRRFGGSGLGTTIAKQLVDLMGGRIGMESAVGLGSTFWVELDLEKQPERVEVGGAGELAHARVLLVGFPAAQREPLEEALAGWGATPIAVETVEAGIARLVGEISLARPYHSALLYANGEALKLARHFRRAAPNPAPPTILAVPRDANVQRFDALTSGFAAILELPFDKRRLFNVLHSVAAGEEIQDGVVRLQDYARSGTARKLRVLVADDNATNREVLGKILERGGHSVTLVNDGEQVLDALEREPFDTVILDRNMPGIGGIEALQGLRLMTRGRERLPVIMLSADVTTEAKREALEAGADAFLPKPVEALRLLEQIQTLSDAAPEKAHRQEGAGPARHAKAAEAPVLNLDTVEQLKQLGSSLSFVEKLAGVFLADNSALLGRIERSLAGRNYHEFRSLLHAMKGSSASMGTDRLTVLCSGMDKLSDAELRLQAPSLLRTLAEELAAARTQLEHYLGERQSSAS
jgi:two-component system sensor histidine kinase RpfC